MGSNLHFGRRLGLHVAIGFLLVSVGALEVGMGCGGGKQEEIIQYGGDQEVPSAPTPSDTIQPPPEGTGTGGTGGTGGTTTGGTTGGTTTGTTTGGTEGSQGAFEECTTDAECGVDPTFGQLVCLSTFTVRGVEYSQIPGLCGNQLLIDATIYATALQCSDGQLNGDETAVDCGGSCGKCPFEGCEADEDCKSIHLLNGKYYTDIRCVDSVSSIDPNAAPVPLGSKKCVNAQLVWDAIAAAIAAMCGDGQCQTHETNASCPADCP